MNLDLNIIVKFFTSFFPLIVTIFMLLFQCHFGAIQYRRNGQGVLVTVFRAGIHRGSAVGISI